MEAHAVFPWRQLGQLLIDQRLLTEDELEQALSEQARTGRLLGQILVDNSYLSAFSLTRVLSEQHGVELRAATSRESEPPKPALADPPEFGSPKTRADSLWRPLGKLLVERGFVTEAQLAGALAEQRDGKGRLGEILVARGLLSGPELARALAEQHGVELETDTQVELQTQLRPSTPDEPTYTVLEVVFEPGYQRRTPVYESANFLEAADYAFEFVQEHEPDALEIHRVDGAVQEAVWNYSASRAAEASATRKELVETFGFDPMRWGVKR